MFIVLIFRISTKEGTQDFIFSTTDVVNGDIVESVVSSGKIIPGEEIKVFSRVTGKIYTKLMSNMAILLKKAKY